MAIEDLIATGIRPAQIMTPFELMAGQQVLNDNKLIGARRQQEMQIEAERAKRLKTSEDLKNIIGQGQYIANVVRNSRPETWERTVRDLEQKMGKQIPNLHFAWDPQKIQDIVNEGLSNVEEVKKAYQQVSTTAGIGNYDPNSGTISLIKDEKGNPFMAPNASPDLQGEIQRSKEQWKGVDVTDPSGAKYRTTQQDANPTAFGGYPNQEPPPVTGGITNPGNIRPQGASTGFQRFDSPEAGLQAMNDNLLAYGKKGINTLAGVISRWSPPNENDTAGLIDAASKRLNLDPNQPIDLSNPLVRNAISTAIMIQEHGSKRLFGSSQEQTPIKGPSLQEQEAIKTEALRENEAIKNQAELDKALPEKQKGIAMFNTILDDLEAKYKELDSQGGITNPDNGFISNIGAGINSSDTGQWLQNKTGAKQQSLRNSILAARPILSQAIMKATGMSSKQMDSNVELQNFMKSATDPQADIKSVLGQIQLLRKLYGGGGGSAMPSSNTSIDDLINKYGGQ